jgi:DNA-binding protein H-NS
VARSVRSIVKLFEKLPFEVQKEALKDLLAAHETARSARRTELERQLVELGYEAPVNMVPVKALTNDLDQRRPKRTANGKTTLVKAKYRNGRTGETWSGRGRMARWLKAKEDAGENIEKYLIN